MYTLTSVLSANFYVALVLAFYDCESSMNNQSHPLYCSFLASSRLVIFQRIDYDSIIILSQQDATKHSEKRMLRAYGENRSNIWETKHTLSKVNQLKRSLIMMNECEERQWNKEWRQERQRGASSPKTWKYAGCTRPSYICSISSPAWLLLMMMIKVDGIGKRKEKIQNSKAKGNEININI